MSGNRFIPVPESVLRIEGLTASDCLVAGSIFKRTVLGNRSDLFIRIEYITNELNISSRTVTDSIQRLVDLRVIEKKRTPRGYRFSFLLTDDQDEQEVTSRNCESQKLRVAESADRDQKNLPIVISRICGSITQTEYTQTEYTQKEISPPTPSRGDDEDFDFDTPQEKSREAAPLVTTSRLPAAKAFTEPIRRPSMPATLSGPQRAMLAQAVGAGGGELRVMRKITQEMADRPGFLESCFTACIEALKARRIKGRPEAYLCGIIEQEWLGGDWTDPAVAQAMADLPEYLAVLETDSLQGLRSTRTDEEQAQLVQMIKDAAAARKQISDWRKITWDFYREKMKRVYG